MTEIGDRVRDVSFPLLFAALTGRSGHGLANRPQNPLATTDWKDWLESRPYTLTTMRELRDAWHARNS